MKNVMVSPAIMAGAAVLALIIIGVIYYFTMTPEGPRTGSYNKRTQPIPAPKGPPPPSQP